MINTPKKILIYRLGSLGDTIMALPCFHKIKDTFPESDITLLTNKPVASKAAPLEAVLGSDYFFDRSLTYPVGTRNPVVLLKLARKIRSLNIDLVVNITALRSLRADQRDRMFFKACGVKGFIGFDQGPGDFEVALDPASGQFEWEAKRLTRKIADLGNIDLSLPQFWDLKLTADELAKARNLLSPLPEGAQFIAFNAGTKMEVKDWGQKNWLELLSSCVPKFSDYHLVAVGAPEDAGFAGECLKAWNDKGLNLCGKGSPRVSATVLKKAELFLGHDSGPMHLAGAVGTPSVAVFSCINQPRQWFPRGDQNRLIFPETGCARNGNKDCSNQDGYCVRHISPKRVETALEKILNPEVAQGARPK